MTQYYMEEVKTEIVKTLCFHSIQENNTKNKNKQKKNEIILFQEKKNESNFMTFLKKFILWNKLLEMLIFILVYT